MKSMEENNEVRAVVDMIVPGKRQRGRTRGRWKDCIRRDMQELCITWEDAKDRTFWKSRIRAADPTLWEKAKRRITGHFSWLGEKVKDRSIPSPRVSFGPQIQSGQHMFSRVVVAQ